MRRAGFVLVGGRSTRMGRDKALLSWGSRLLIQHVVEQVAASVGGNVALVGTPERYAAIDFAPHSAVLLADAHPGKGPVAGIEAALRSGRGDLNLIVSCDAPTLTEGWFEQLFQVAENTDAGCAVTVDQSGRVHPLCGVYRTRILSVVQRNLRINRLRAMDLVEDLEGLRVVMDAILPNLNTPDDWFRFENARAGAL